MDFGPGLKMETEMIFRKGQRVETIKIPQCSINAGHPLKIGIRGVVIGVRHGATDRLVKFVGRSGPIQCDTSELTEINGRE
jgi:hypothetical protein